MQGRRELTLGAALVGLGLTAILTALFLVALPAGALADTIHLEVSPSTPPRGGIMTVTASGSASSTEDQIRVASPPPGENCPTQYPGFATELTWERPLSNAAYTTTPTYRNSNFIYLDGAGSVICGYLTVFIENKETYTGEEVTLASTELQVTYGPSKAEVEAAEAAKAKYEAEAPARKAATESAEAQAQHATDAKARELAEQAPVSLLRVKAVAHPGNSATSPGHTSIVVTTNTYAHVTITATTLNHPAGTFHYRAPGNGGGAVAWTCRHPGLTYHYVVAAVGGSGPTLRRSKSFRTVSASRCHALTIADERRAAERHRQEAREGKEQKHKEQEEKRHEESPEGQIEKGEAEYCKKILYGVPGSSKKVAGRIYTYCFGRLGGEPAVEVPEGVVG